MGGKKKTSERQAVKDRRELRNARKGEKRMCKEMGVDEKVTVESVMQKWSEENEAKLKSEAVSLQKSRITICEQPSPRIGFSVSSTGAGFILFGGEWYNGKSCKVYNELFKYDSEKEQWSQIISLHAPKARCSHQAVVFRDDIFVFGGEFSTQYQFHHYKDLWSLNLKTLQWTELKECGGAVPSARSGHRMTVCRGYIILYGGFFDAGKETKYFNDVYVLDLKILVWVKLKTNQGPCPRGGHVLAAAPDGDGVLVFGGYSKLKETEREAQGKCHGDSWWLDLSPLFEIKSVDHFTSNGLGVFSWQKLSTRASHAPSKRTGASMTVVKQSGILFGGLCDDDKGGLTMEKTDYFSDLYSFEFSSRKWRSLKVRIDKKDDLEISTPVDSVVNSSVFDVPLLSKDKDDESIVLSKISDTTKEGDCETRKTNDSPCGRASAGLCHLANKNELVVVGGSVEKGEKIEILLDDLWRLHLSLKSGWVELNQGTYKTQEWIDSSSSSSSSSEGEEPDDEDNDSDVDEDGSNDSSTESEADSEPIENESQQSKDSLAESEFPVPLQNETLREFSNRTNNFWKSFCLNLLSPESSQDVFLNNNNIPFDVLTEFERLKNENELNSSGCLLSEDNKKMRTLIFGMATFVFARQQKSGE